MPRDARSVAVIGARNATPNGIAMARAIAGRFAQVGYTVVSGLARGIDTAAHGAALKCGGRTVAVVGNGLERCYPPENIELQEEICERAAAVSRFWPEARPTSRHFPLRNAVMSGMTLGTVIVEAGRTSGARTQARFALGHGRPVLLMKDLLGEDWARQLAGQPGVHVVESPEDAIKAVEHLASPDILPV